MLSMDLDNPWIACTNVCIVALYEKDTRSLLGGILDPFWGLGVGGYLLLVPLFPALIPLCVILC